MDYSPTKYNFTLSDNGSYIQVPTSLPATGTTEICQNGSYLVNQCNSNTQCASPNNNCEDNCYTKCDGYMSTPTGQTTDLCCHSNNSSAQDISCCDDTGTWVAGGCGQVENMASCGIVVADRTSPCPGSQNWSGTQLSCTRSCSARCKVLTSVDNNFRYMGVFQLNAGRQDDNKNFPCVAENNCMADLAKGCPEMASGLVQPWQNCIYDVNAYTTQASGTDITNWSAAYPAKDRNYDEVMTKWCAVQVTGNCLWTTSDTCARHFQNSPEGLTCRDWLANQTESVQPSLQDAIALRYCR